MGQAIKHPPLESTSPPFFELEVGHEVKIFPRGASDSYWVHVLEIQDDQLLGRITARHRPEEGAGHCEQHDRPLDGPAPGLAASRPPLGIDDIVVFETRHVFGLY